MKSVWSFGDEVRGFARGIRLLIENTLNYDQQQAVKAYKKKLVKTVVGGGKVVDPSLIKDQPSADFRTAVQSALTDAYERAAVAGTGVKSYVDLMARGIYPGSAGYTVSSDSSDASVTEQYSGRSSTVSEATLNDKPTVGQYQDRAFYRPQLPEDYKMNIPDVRTIEGKNRERRVPSSRIARLANFAQLGIGLATGAAVEVVKRRFALASPFGASNQSKTPIHGLESAFITPANAEKIVLTLCKVRGAALKLGQMLSIQDPETVSPVILNVFERVRDSADYMPVQQVRQQLRSNFGADWMDRFVSFDEKPFAAASIGQVHLATVDGIGDVAVKIQYPGVADGIDSDIDNLMSVMRYANFLPKGLFLQEFTDVIREELKLECDYEREARAMNIFRKFTEDDKDLYVPKMIDSLTTKQILTTEFIKGSPVDKCVNEPQEVRDYVARNFVELCLKEMFQWKFMQTDPNWSNFFFGYHPVTGEQCFILLDFGAARSYPKKFIDSYMHILRGAYECDREKILHYSQEIGFLSGYESAIMTEAHIDSIMILGETLASKKPYDFSRQDVTKRVNNLIPVMLKHRIKAPPDEIYSLHRKLSGSFLLATKLKAKVSCGPIFDTIYRNYVFGDDGSETINIDNV